jgi:hypothetical protein
MLTTPNVAAPAPAATQPTGPCGSPRCATARKTTMATALLTLHCPMLNAIFIGR